MNDILNAEESVTEGRRAALTRMVESDEEMERLHPGWMTGDDLANTPPQAQAPNTIL